MKLIPLVSICIPTHNQNPVFLRKCIESVIRQTYENIEIIINNNNTTNESLNYLKSILNETGKTIKIFTNEYTVSLSESFAQAIKNATGEYLFILPSDDFIEENAIEILVNTLNENPDADCICGQWRYVDKEFNNKGIKQNQVYYKNKDLQIYDSISFKNNYFIFSLLRADYLKSMGIYTNNKIKLAEDMVFTIEVTLHGKVVVINEIIANFQGYNPKRKERVLVDIIDTSEIMYTSVKDIVEDKSLKNTITKLKISNIILNRFLHNIKVLTIMAVKLAITPAQLINTLSYVVKTSFSSMVLLNKP
jgi:glycosyltransferase involved in cell wall biosynthesis